MARYATNSDLERLFTNFTLQYYGTYIDDDPELATFNSDSQAKLDRDLDVVSSYIDSKLSALGYNTPLRTVDGTRYDYFVTDWCAYLTIHRRLIAYTAVNEGLEFPEWIDYFKQQADSIYEAIANGDIALDADISLKESGIGYVEVVSGSNNAFFENNRAYGGVYSNNDLTATFYIEIDGTNAGNEIGKATFKWSVDGGYSFEYTKNQTGTSWIELRDGVKVRWIPNTNATTQLNLGDSWKFVAVPLQVNVKTGGNYAKPKYFGRG